MQALSRAAAAVATSVVGVVLVVAGIVMLVTPGPGLLSIAAGLALLARTFPWAHRLQERGHRTIQARLHRHASSRVEQLEPRQTTPAISERTNHDAA